MNHEQLIFKEVNAPELNVNGRSLIDGFSTGFGISMAFGAFYIAAT
ncbi:hypothetical protein [Limosilactobacillus reuteri]|nr:hypothetical protein [Limosilactobacillus reuteri]MCH5379284.1 hypothetical protein [Limosilactobacillus reuteri]